MTAIHTRILVIEDDEGICTYLHSLLTREKYEVYKARTGSEALFLATSQCPDLILLDLGLPDIDGTAIISSIRQWSRVPIIVISARLLEEDKARALDLGADDYLAKPFGSIELMARIRAALRRTSSPQEGPVVQNGVLSLGQLQIDFSQHKVFFNQQDVHLTPNEFRILAFLARTPGEIVTYKQLLRELWGPYTGNDNKVLRFHMAAIRRKIEPNPSEPQYLFTEPGLGYRLCSP